MTQQTVKQLHENIGNLPANKVSERLMRWYNATEKLLAKKETSKCQDKDARSGKG